MEGQKNRPDQRNDWAAAVETPRRTSATTALGASDATSLPVRLRVFLRLLSLCRAGGRSTDQCYRMLREARRKWVHTAWRSGHLCRVEVLETRLFVPKRWRLWMRWRIRLPPLPAIGSERFGARSGRDGGRRNGRWRGWNGRLRDGSATFEPVRVPLAVAVAVARFARRKSRGSSDRGGAKLVQKCLGPNDLDLLRQASERNEGVSAHAARGLFDRSGNRMAFERSGFSAMASVVNGLCGFREAPRSLSRRPTTERMASFGFWSARAAQKEPEHRWKAFRLVALAPVGPLSERLASLPARYRSSPRFCIPGRSSAPPAGPSRWNALTRTNAFFLASAMPGIGKVKSPKRADASHFLVVGHADEEGKTREWNSESRPSASRPWAEKRLKDLS